VLVSIDRAKLQESLAKLGKAYQYWLIRKTIIHLHSTLHEITRVTRSTNLLDMSIVVLS